MGMDSSEALARVSPTGPSKFEVIGCQCIDFLSLICLPVRGHCCISTYINTFVYVCTCIPSRDKSTQSCLFAGNLFLLIPRVRCFLKYFIHSVCVLVQPY